MKTTAGHWAIPVLALFCLLPGVSAGTALFLGLGTAFTLGNPYGAWIKPQISRLLGVAIVGLGASLNLHEVLRAGTDGLVYTLVGISFTFAVGLRLGKKLKVDAETSLLITAGTAIWGGSAIAAMAAAVRARTESAAIALGTVFCLNAVALYLFPVVARAIDLTPSEFGLWSALAIHDTSSVVGAALRYHPDSLPVATTVKLARALWIAPTAFTIGFFWPTSSPNPKVRRWPSPPWFIVGFLSAAALVTFFPAWQPIGMRFSEAAKRLFVLTLFFIGSGLTRALLRQVGARPLSLGFWLWVTVSLTTLAAIRGGLIS